MISIITMPNFTFTVTNSDTSTNLSTFPKNVRFNTSTLATPTTAVTYIQRFIAIAGLSSTSLGSISAAVHGLDGLGQSFS